MFRSSICALMTAGLLLCATATAGPLSQSSKRHRVLPVLVAVNSHGKVTRVEPAVRLMPRQTHAVERLLKTIITGPAVHDGEPVSSQFVVMLRLEPVPADDHDYRLVFDSARPVRSRHAHWVMVRRGGTYKYGLGYPAWNFMRDNHPRKLRIRHAHGSQDRTGHPGPLSKRND